MNRGLMPTRPHYFGPDSPRAIAQAVSRPPGARSVLARRAQALEYARAHTVVRSGCPEELHEQSARDREHSLRDERHFPDTARAAELSVIRGVLSDIGPPHCRF